MQYRGLWKDGAVFGAGSAGGVWSTGARTANVKMRWRVGALIPLNGNLNGHHQKYRINDSNYLTKRKNELKKERIKNCCICCCMSVALLQICGLFVVLEFITLFLISNLIFELCFELLSKCPK